MKNIKKFIPLLIIFLLVFVVACGKIKSIKILGEDEVMAGETLQLEIEKSPKKAKAEIVWSSSNSQLAEVDSESGLVSAIMGGEVTIKAVVKDSDPEISDTKIIKIVIANIESIEIKNVKSSIFVGEELVLGVNVLPAGLPYNVSWTTSNNQVATVSASGVVNGVGAGNVKIKASISESIFDEVEINVINVVVASVSINGPEKIETGAVVKYTANVLPENATDKSITWSVDKTDIATIDQNGELTVKTSGTIKIKATAHNGIFDEKSVVIDKTEDIDVISLTVNGSNSITSSANVTYTVTFNPTNATNKNIVWSVDDESIAIINPNTGVLTPKISGVVKVIATAHNGVTGERSVTINLPSITITGVEINKTGLDEDVIAGESILLTAVVKPAGASQAIIWESDDESVATIDESGLVLFIGYGPVTIIAKAAGDETKTDEFFFYVEYATVEGVEVNNDRRWMTVNETVQIIANVYPIYASQVVFYTIAEGIGIASISPSGLLTPNKSGIGKVLVRVTTIIPSIYEEIEIEIVWDEVESIEIIHEFISIEELTINVTTRKIISAKLNPDGAYDEVTWSSSDEEVIIFDTDGGITALKVGTSIIRAQVSNGVYKEIEVKVIVPEATFVGVSGDTYLFLNVSDTLIFNVIVMPNGASQEVVWDIDGSASISQLGVAKFTEGGSYVVTATQGSVVGSFDVIVYDAKPTYDENNYLVANYNYKLWEKYEYEGAIYYGGITLFNKIENIEWKDNLTVELAPGVYSLSAPIIMSGNNISLVGPYAGVKAIEGGRGEEANITAPSGFDVENTFRIVGGSSYVTIDGIMMSGNVRLSTVIGPENARELDTINILNVYGDNFTGAGGGFSVIGIGTNQGQAFTTNYNKDVTIDGCYFFLTGSDRVFRIYSTDNLYILNSSIFGGADVMLLGAPDSTSHIGAQGDLIIDNCEIGKQWQYAVRINKFTATCNVEITNNVFLGVQRNKDDGTYRGVLDFGMNQGDTTAIVNILIEGNQFIDTLQFHQIKVRRLLANITGLTGVIQNNLFMSDIYTSGSSGVHANMGSEKWGYISIDGTTNTATDNLSKFTIEYNAFLLGDGTYNDNLSYRLSTGGNSVESLGTGSVGFFVGVSNVGDYIKNDLTSFEEWENIVNYIPAASIEVVATSYYLLMTPTINTMQFSINVLPSNASKNVVWSIVGAGAEINEDGRAKFPSTGIYQITATQGSVFDVFTIYVYASDYVLDETMVLISTQEFKNYEMVEWEGVVYVGNHTIHNKLEDVKWVNNLEVLILAGNYTISSTVEISGENISIIGPAIGIKANGETRSSGEATFTGAIDYAIVIVSGSIDIGFYGLSFVGAKISTKGSGTIDGLYFFEVNSIATNPGAANQGLIVLGANLENVKTTTLHKNIHIKQSYFNWVGTYPNPNARTLRLYATDGLYIYDSYILGGADALVIGDNVANIGHTGSTGDIHITDNTIGDQWQYAVRINKVFGIVDIKVYDNIFTMKTVILTNSNGAYRGVLDMGNEQSDMSAKVFVDIRGNVFENCLIFTQIKVRLSFACLNDLSGIIHYNLFRSPIYTSGVDSIHANYGSAKWGYISIDGGNLSSTPSSSTTNLEKFSIEYNAFLIDSFTKNMNLSYRISTWGGSSPYSSGVGAGSVAWMVANPEDYSLHEFSNVANLVIAYRNYLNTL